MSSNQMRKWLNLVESTGHLNEFTADGENPQNWYQATVDFIEEYKSDRLANGDELEDFQDDLDWLQNLAKSFLQSFKAGIDFYFDLDTMLRDELAEWYTDQGLDIQKYIDQRREEYRARQAAFNAQQQALANKAPASFNDQAFAQEFAEQIQAQAARTIEEFSSDRQLGNWWAENFNALMMKNAGVFANKIKQALKSNPDVFEYDDDFIDQVGTSLIDQVYYNSSLHKLLDQKDPVVADDVALSVGPNGAMALWAAYVAATGR